MHARGIVLLVALVAALAGLRLWTDQRAAEEDGELRQVLASYALLEGITPADFAKLGSLSIDNLERNVQVRMERDSGGRWFLIDPVAWPADTAVLKLFFDTLAGDAGREVDDVGAEAAGLEPPMARTELDFGSELGTWTVEIGRPDIDGRRLYIRTAAPGKAPRILRANRSLEGIFQRFVPDYRSQAILRIEPTEVAEVRRRGSRDYPSYFGATGQIGPAKADLPNPLLVAQGERFATLELQLVDGKRGWELREPYAGAADPQAITMLLLTLCNLDASAFHAEDVSDLARFGFDRPELEIELGTVDGVRHRLRFAREPDERGRAELEGYGVEASTWLCLVDDGPVVFEVDPRVVMLAAGPAEAFFDYRILRGDLEQASACRVEGAGRVSQLVREDGRWWVSGTTRAGQHLEHRPADLEMVEELLARFRGAELIDLLPGAEPAPSLVAESLAVTIAGLERGGTFSPPMAGTDAEYLFKRSGDKIWASVDPALVEALRLGPEHFLERRLVDVDELRLGSISLSRRERGARFLRDAATGRWTRAGETQEARDFVPLVDRLRSLKAVDFELVPNDMEGGTEPIHVALELVAEPGPRGAPAEEVVYSVGHSTEADIYLADGHGARLFPGLWAALDDLLRP